MSAVIQIKSVFGKVLFEYEKENNTLKKTLARAVSEGAYLQGADLRDAELRGANFQSANLRSANLRGAELRGANLEGANLWNTNLEGADLDKKYVSVTRIGSRKGMTTYCFEDDRIWCGCFIGTLEEFTAQIEETHKDNPVYLAEYREVIAYLDSLKKVYSEEEK
jgi:hypothetical protein